MNLRFIPRSGGCDLMIKLKIAFCIGISLSFLFGQDNQPPKPLSKSEIEAAFNRSLKLDQIPRGAIDLELEGTLPTEKDIEEKHLFYRNAPSIAIDERGHIYIPQGYPIGVIDELDADGRLVLRFDRKGQGPGDIQNPGYILFSGQQVIVCDNLTRRMSFFDQRWKYIRSFSLPQPGYSIILGGNGLFYIGNLHGDKLVSIMDMDGKITGSFGQPPFQGSFTLNTLVLGAAPEGSIWVGMQALGVLRRYSITGGLEREIDLVSSGSDLIKNDYKENLQWAEKGVQKCHALVLEIAFAGDDVFVLTGGGVLQPIYRLDKEGILKAVYYVKPKIQRSLRSLNVRLAKNGDMIFYIWQMVPDLDEPRVGVYGIKKDKS
jgi:hypothetical protein